MLFASMLVAPSCVTRSLQLVAHTFAGSPPSGSALSFTGDFGSAGVGAVPPAPPSTHTNFLLELRHAAAAAPATPPHILDPVVPPPRTRSALRHALAPNNGYLRFQPTGSPSPAAATSPPRPHLPSLPAPFPAEPGLAPPRQRAAPRTPYAYVGSGSGAGRAGSGLGGDVGGGGAGQTERRLEHVSAMRAELELVRQELVAGGRAQGAGGGRQDAEAVRLARHTQC